MVDVVKLKLSSCVEGNIKDNQRCCVHSVKNATTATTHAKGIKVKLPKNIFADVKLNQNEL